MTDEAVLQAAIERGRRDALGSGRPEAVLREAVQPALAEILHGRGLRSSARNEVTLAVPPNSEAPMLDAPLTTMGRADAVYNRFVIEFEPPGSLRPSIMHSNTQHAVGQVQQYMRGAEQGLGLQLDRVAGCAFDGNWIGYVRWERGGWHVEPPIRVDLDSLRALIEVIASLAKGRGLKAENLDEDFGRESDSARIVVGSLSRLFSEGTVSGRGLSMLNQWSLDLGNASGPFSPSDLREWRELCASLGVPDSEVTSRSVLFSLQTYFSLVAKLVALVILEGATGKPLVRQLLREDRTILEAFRALESGALTRPSMAVNAIEPGVFSWYLGEPASNLGNPLRHMAMIAAEYSAEVVEITPLVARDVLKDLFQRLLPRAIRHRLGEYYTPDWLAQRVINQVTGSMQSLEPTYRVLDPACGSGTFLVEVISRMVSTAGGRDPGHTLAQILENVVGFDLSPLAVQASKVNYLLALAPLLRHASQPIFIPVFLADSVSPPRQRGLLEGDVLTFESSEGDWRVPASLAEAHYLPELGSIFQEGLAEDRGFEWLREQLERRIPVLETADRNVLDEAEGLYGKLVDLERTDRNGMWWHLVSNAFAPRLQGTFDFIVGNPPWVSWETLPEPYRRANDDLWLDYHLRPDAAPGRRQSSANVRLDLSMLFVARCIDQYLVSGGKLGFVITSTVFKSELAGRGFRRRHLPSGGVYRFNHIDDMTSLSIFEGATNQASVLISERRPPRRLAVPVLVWRPSGQRRIPTAMELELVSSMTTRREFFAEPVNPSDEASPSLMMSRVGLAESKPLRNASPYLELVREGVNTRGANGVFFVEILERDGALVRIRNVPAEGRNRHVTRSQGWVESEVIRLLLRGSDVSPGRAEPVLGVLMFHDESHVSYPIPADEVDRRYPRAFSYMSNFESILRGRGRFRNFDPSGNRWLGIYSVTTAALADHKVVVREIASGMIAAPVHGSNIIPDHKLYVIPCVSAREADRLAKVLNSRVVNYMIHSFALSTSITGSFLRYVGVKNLSDLAEAGDPQLDMANALGLTLDQFTTLDSVARTELPYLQGER